MFLTDFLESESFKYLAEPLQRDLNRLFADRTVVAHYLNSLSYLEFLGAVSIGTSFRLADMTLYRLRQMNEEALHSLMFRKIAERVSETAMTYEPQHLFHATQTKYWFFRLAAAVKRKLAQEIDGAELDAMTSMYVSALLEVRTTWWYPKVQAAANHNGHDFTLANIIEDEAFHIESLDRILKEGDPQFERRMRMFHLVEAANFLRFQTATHGPELA